MDSPITNAPTPPVPETPVSSRQVVINSNSVYILNSSVVVNINTPAHQKETRGFSDWLDNVLHAVKASAVKIAICIVGLVALWAFVSFDVLHLLNIP